MQMELTEQQRSAIYRQLLAAKAHHQEGISLFSCRPAKPSIVEGYQQDLREAEELLAMFDRPRTNRR